MEKIKVIIADDIQAIVESNKRIVASFDNVEVIGTAYNGQDEYDMIINLQPDLVITDNQMPIMNGIDVIKNIVNSNISKKHFKLFGNRKHKIKKGKNFFIK